MSTTTDPVCKKRKMTANGEEAPLAPTETLLIKRLSDKAKLPTRGSALSAGYDLYRRVNSACGSLIDSLSFSAEHKIVPARGKAAIDTQISLAVPLGHYGRVAPRSGLGASWQTLLWHNLRFP